MSLKPIFDTNVFGHVESGRIPSSRWEHLLAHRPRHGWPLSQVTALELLAGLHLAGSDRFSCVKRRIELALQLSKGRVLEDPRVLICKRILRVPVPSELATPAAAPLSKYLDIVRRGKTLDQVLRDGVPYHGARIQISGTSVVVDLMQTLKNQWVNAVESMATATYPDWRVLFRQSGRRLPTETRKEFEPTIGWHELRPLFVNDLLGRLHAKVDANIANQVTTRLDAMLEFTIFVMREFLLRNYSLKKHDSTSSISFNFTTLPWMISSSSAAIPTCCAESRNPRSYRGSCLSINSFTRSDGRKLRRSRQV